MPENLNPDFFDKRLLTTPCLYSRNLNVSNIYEHLLQLYDPGLVGQYSSTMVRIWDRYQIYIYIRVYTSYIYIYIYIVYIYIWCVYICIYIYIYIYIMCIHIYIYIHHLHTYNIYIYTYTLIHISYLLPSTLLSFPHQRIPQVVADHFEAQQLGWSQQPAAVLAGAPRHTSRRGHGGHSEVES